ncbi:MAG: hypothetical protein K8S27_15145 [Candidatus Omnitrophica bacterium]|nr:hypothetical protein [Candidatus Omnitrophota bacterium]
MLPDDAEFTRSLKFLRESNFSDKVVLSLSLKDADHSVSDLLKVADQFKKNLKPPLVEKIESGILEKEILDDINQFLVYVPQIVAKGDLSAIESRVTPEHVNEKLKQGYKNMLSMNSMFLKSFIENDPLGVKIQYFQKMKELGESIGYKAKFKDGHFISLDDRHIMLILTTPILITDSAGARKLINYIHAQIDMLPEYINVDIISGHLHTLSNEDIIKKDIAKTVFAASLMLLVLLVIVFRSARALLVFIIPAVAILISMNLTSMMIGALSSFIVGLAAVIAGITVDYGIHIYLAMHAGGLRKVNKISRPVMVGVFTTMGVFASFFFSSIYGYQQFALLTNLSIVISIFFYLFILPGLFYKKNENIPLIKINFRKENPIFHDSVIVFLWLIVLGCFMFFSQHSTFSNDVRVYDGSSEEIFKAEDRFHQTWGGGDEFAMMVAQADTLQDVLKLNEELNTRLKRSFENAKVANIAEVYPSKKTREKNLLRWNSLWKNKLEGKTKKLLKEQGMKFGYSKNAFKPFFDELYNSSVADDETKEPKLLDKVKNRFLQKTKNGFYAISYFSDKEALIDKAQKISKKMAGTFIISRKNMTKSISESVYQEVKKLSWIAGSLIVILTILLLKNIRLTLLALIPVVTSVFMILGGFSLLGYALNAPSMVAILVVVGLCIDYGVFMVYDCKFKLEAGTLLAVTLSAMTTIVGGSVLLLATHPVLFYVGVTMAIGIFSGYLVAAFVIPACYRLWISPRG